MKKNKALSLVGIGLCAVSAILFAVLYFTPYHLKNTERYESIARPTSSLNLVSKYSLSLAKPEALNGFSFKVDFNLLEKENYLDFVSKTNLKSDLYDDNFFTKKNLLLLSFKGKIMRYSKATKLKVNSSTIGVFFSVENDYILNGTAKPDDETYTYYLVPVDAKYLTQDRYSLAIRVKKV